MGIGGVQRGPGGPGAADEVGGPAPAGEQAAADASQGAAKAPAAKGGAGAKAAQTAHRQDPAAIRLEKKLADKVGDSLRGKEGALVSEGEALRLGERDPKALARLLSNAERAGYEFRRDYEPFWAARERLENGTADLVDIRFIAKVIDTFNIKEWDVGVKDGAP
jgi:hypothetical protein